MGKRESGIQKRTVDLLYKNFEHIVARVKHGTMFAVAGDPDIYGVVQGRGFGFEVKNEDGELSKIQIQRLKEWKKAGAIAEAIREPKEAVFILNRELNVRF